jgi:small subunit ribosomal protein S20
MAEKETEKKAKVKRPTPIKRDLQNEKRRLRNRAFKASVRTTIRRFDETLSKGDAEASKQVLNDAYSIMDKGVKLGVFKQNKANRTKARLAARAAAHA